MEPTKDLSAQRDPEASAISEDQQQISRRNLLAKVTALMGIAATQGWFPAETVHAKSGHGDPTKVPGGPPRPYGKRSSFESSLRRQKQIDR